MDVIQILLSKMAVFAYIVADPSTGDCTLIDPAFDVDKILGIVKKKGYQVTSLINTHCHSDHTAGNAAVIQKTGAKLLIHKADAKYLKGLPNRMLTRAVGGKKSPQPDMLLRDGNTIYIGNTNLKVLHTPGHTPGGICLYGEGNLFTGDTLFQESIGRTDLPGGSLKQLVRSVKTKLFVLPDKTIVWPGHNYGRTPTSTIGHEKNRNPFIR